LKASAPHRLPHIVVRDRTKGNLGACRPSLDPLPGGLT